MVSGGWKRGRDPKNAVFLRDRPQKRGLGHLSGFGGARGRGQQGLGRGYRLGGVENARAKNGCGRRLKRAIRETGDFLRSFCA